MAQQTAVEWLKSEWQKKDIDISIRELFEQAKAMEKEQIIKTYNNAINKMDYFIQPESAEQYYNETYNNGTI
jgi:hypothetical protein